VRAEDPVAAWAGRWWTIWGTVDLVPAGRKVLVAWPGRLDPFAEASELEVLSASQARITLADGFGSHGEPGERTIGPDGAPSRLKHAVARFTRASLLSAVLRNA
jgi:D-alanyl-D-alanine carboxypeptidase